MDVEQAKHILGITDMDDGRTAKIKYRRLIGQYHPDEEEFHLFLRSMLDSDLAMLYQVETGNLNKAMRRNPKRFPDDSFCFQLTKEEFVNLNFQNGISSSESSTHGGCRKLPLVYTEQGIAMGAGRETMMILLRISLLVLHSRNSAAAFP